MYVAIFKGKEQKSLMESSVDLFHPLYDDTYTGDVQESNFQFFNDNFGSGELFSGDPICDFEGTDIPTAMIRYGEKVVSLLLFLLIPFAPLVN